MPRNLAMIRRAGDLTQVEVAEKLGVGQAVVSRLERRSDMLLSTLADYLHATGPNTLASWQSSTAWKVELDLDQFREPRSA